MPDVIKMVNNLTSNRITVDAQGWNLHLDPRAYTMELELELDGMRERETELVQAGDKQGQIDLLSGLLERVLLAKSLPQELADPKLLLLRVQKILLTHGETDALDWIGITLAGLDDELNPGWDAETIKKRLQKEVVGKTLVFFDLLSSGKLAPRPSPIPEPEKAAPTMPDTGGASAQETTSRGRGSASGAGSSRTSSRRTRRTPSKTV